MSPAPARSAEASLLDLFSRTTPLATDPAYSKELPLPEELYPAYDFWARVYGEWTSRSAVLHRDRSYELKRDRRGRVVLYDTESDYVGDYSNHSHKKAARSKGRDEYWRMQRGKSDLVPPALETYYYYRDAMEAALAGTGVPRDLLALGFLESLYRPEARSRTGAVGVFQIQPWEGFNLGAVMTAAWDELPDPVAEARLMGLKLETDRRKLLDLAKKEKISVGGNSLWPLVLSGYNQGIHSVMSAVSKEKTLDYFALIYRHHGKRFGFAGRNFYVQLRLFADLVRNGRGKLEKRGWPRMPKTAEVSLDAYVAWPELVRACGLDGAALRPLNLAVSEPGRDGTLRLPPGARIRVPAEKRAALAACLEKGPGRRIKHKTQVPLAAYRVSRGETLTSIARRLDSSIFHIMATNGLGRAEADRLKAGDRVKIPTRRFAELARTAEEWLKKGRPLPQAFTLYRLRKGDTVSRVEKRFGLVHPELAKWNDVSNWAAGRTVYVPRYP